MKDRGKAVEVYGGNEFLQDYSFSSDLPCRKHPQSSYVGICPFCLKDRLVKLVCSDCGEQRLSSCSCSEISSNSRTSCAGEVGSVGRVSFLIENENRDPVIPAKARKIGEKLTEEVFLLKRSNSSCVEIKRKNGFWKIGRLFRRKDRKDCGRSVAAADARSDLWVVDYAGGVSRSRSLCSFRGNGFFGSEDGGDLMNYSGARSSISAARSSSVNGGLLFDPERKSGFSEAEPRKSGFDSDRRDSTDIGPGGNGNRRVFSLKESYFSGGDDSGFIDLKFDSESKSDTNMNMNISSFKKGVVSDSKSTFGSMRVGDVVPPESGEGLAGDGIFYSGGCRGMVSDRGIKKGRKSFKGWRWIFKHHQTWASNPRKKDEDEITNVNHP